MAAAIVEGSCDHAGALITPGGTENDTSKMLAIMDKLGIARINLITPETPVDTHALLDAATDALEQIDHGRSRLVMAFQDVAMKGRISETII